jgi:hypothetical protein
MQKKLEDSSVEVTLRYRSLLQTESIYFPSTSVLSRSALAEDENLGGIRPTGVVEVAFFQQPKESDDKGRIACSVSLLPPLVMSSFKDSPQETEEEFDHHASEHLRGVFRYLSIVHVQNVLLSPPQAAVHGLIQRKDSDAVPCSDFFLQTNYSHFIGAC